MFSLLSKGNQLLLEARTNQSLLSMQVFCFSVTFFCISRFSLFIGSFISACFGSSSLQTKKTLPLLQITLWLLPPFRLIAQFTRVVCTHRLRFIASHLSPACCVQIFFFPPNQSCCYKAASNLHVAR